MFSIFTVHSKLTCSYCPPRISYIVQQSNGVHIYDYVLSRLPMSLLPSKQVQEAHKLVSTLHPQFLASLVILIQPLCLLLQGHLILKRKEKTSLTIVNIFLKLQRYCIHTKCNKLSIWRFFKCFGQAIMVLENIVFSIIFLLIWLPYQNFVMWCKF